MVEKEKSKHPKDFQTGTEIDEQCYVLAAAFVEAVHDVQINHCGRLRGFLLSDKIKRTVVGARVRKLEDKLQKSEDKVKHLEGQMEGNKATQLEQTRVALQNCQQDYKNLEAAKAKADKRAENAELKNKHLEADCEEWKQEFFRQTAATNRAFGNLPPGLREQTEFYYTSDIPQNATKLAPISEKRAAPYSKKRQT